MQNQGGRVVNKDTFHEFERELDIEHISLDTQELRNDVRNLCNLVNDSSINNPFKMVYSYAGQQEFSSNHSQSERKNYKSQTYNDQDFDIDLLDQSSSKKGFDSGRERLMNLLPSQDRTMDYQGPNPVSKIESLLNFLHHEPPTESKLLNKYSEVFDDRNFLGEEVQIENVEIEDDGFYPIHHFHNSKSSKFQYVNTDQKGLENCEPGSEEKAIQVIEQLFNDYLKSHRQNVVPEKLKTTFNDWSSNALPQDSHRPDQGLNQRGWNGSEQKTPISSDQNPRALSVDYDDETIAKWLEKLKKGDFESLRSYRVEDYFSNETEGLIAGYTSQFESKASERFSRPQESSENFGSQTNLTSRRSPTTARELDGRLRQGTGQNQELNGQSLEQQNVFLKLREMIKVIKAAFKKVGNHHEEQEIFDAIKSLFIEEGFFDIQRSEPSNRHLNSGQIIEKFSSKNSFGEPNSGSYSPKLSHLNPSKIQSSKVISQAIQMGFVQEIRQESRQASPDQQLVYQSYSSYQPPHIQPNNSTNSDKITENFTKKRIVEIISSNPQNSGFQREDQTKKSSQTNLSLQQQAESSYNSFTGNNKFLGLGKYSVPQESNGQECFSFKKTEKIGQTINRTQIQSMFTAENNSSIDCSGMILNQTPKLQEEARILPITNDIQAVAQTNSKSASGKLSALISNRLESIAETSMDHSSFMDKDLGTSEKNYSFQCETGTKKLPRLNEKSLSHENGNEEQQKLGQKKDTQDLFFDGNFTLKEGLNDGKNSEIGDQIKCQSNDSTPKSSTGIQKQEFSSPKKQINRLYDNSSSGKLKNQRVSKGHVKKKTDIETLFSETAGIPGFLVESQSNITSQIGTAQVSSNRLDQNYLSKSSQQSDNPMFTFKNRGQLAAQKPRPETPVNQSMTEPHLDYQISHIGSYNSSMKSSEISQNRSPLVEKNDTETPFVINFDFKKPSVNITASSNNLSHQVPCFLPDELVSQLSTMRDAEEDDFMKNQSLKTNSTKNSSKNLAEQSKLLVPSIGGVSLLSRKEPNQFSQQSSTSILRLKPFESINSQSTLQGGSKSSNQNLSSKNSDLQAAPLRLGKNPKIVSSYTVKSQSGGLKSHTNSTQSDQFNSFSSFGQSHSQINRSSLQGGSLRPNSNTLNSAYPAHLKEQSIHLQQPTKDLLTISQQDQIDVLPKSSSSRITDRKFQNVYQEESFRRLINGANKENLHFNYKFAE